MVQDPGMTIDDIPVFQHPPAVFGSFGQASSCRIHAAPRRPPVFPGPLAKSRS